jgi:hypothetical protein
MKHLILFSVLFIFCALVACQEPIQDLTLGQLVMVRDVGKNDVMYFKVLVQNTLVSTAIDLDISIEQKKRHIRSKE